ncbi:MAG: hypothetical protein HYV96_17110 [Opitutae bacterium]|nr:hypothetical protein [Opitutae bacterium]
MKSPLSLRLSRFLPGLLCLAALAAVLLMIDLKGISTDEGFRLWITNGGQPRALGATPDATWTDVLAAVNPYAYQPGYYLLQNTLMRAAARQDLNFFRLTNIAFFALCLWGLLRLSRPWAAWPRAFLVGLFAFNAYLIMHVLQIREYIVATAFYIWSTQIVLALDRRQLGDEWKDIGWFVGYGLLLSATFYVQTWIVFPAIGQGAFLVLRRRPQFWRFHAHLAVCYLLVFSSTWPYLQSHSQKVNVGLWEREHVTLVGQLLQGFNLVLSGHLPRHDTFTMALPWAWLGLLAAGAWWTIRRRSELPAAFVAETSRQAWLMLVCIAMPLAFQVAYFFKVEPLSVWPRYFIVHYFFLTWLIALAFRTLHEASGAPTRRRTALTVLTTATALLAVSAAYQVNSFRRDPYLDTSLSTVSDWRVGTAALAPTLRPDDVLLTHDFITRATLTFTHPTAHRVLILDELEKVALPERGRLVYLEQALYRQNTSDVVVRLRALGFRRIEASALVDANGTPLSEWKLFAFTRD